MRMEVIEKVVVDFEMIILGVIAIMTAMDFRGVSVVQIVMMKIKGVRK